MLNEQKEVKLQEIYQQANFPHLEGAKNYVRLIRRLLGSLKDQKILDIACGSEKEKIGSEGLSPWYPLVLLLAASEGARGTGIDLGEFDASKDFYYHIQADLIPYLTNIHPLIDLFANAPAEHSPPFDFILCLNFLDNVSPMLDKTVTEIYDNDYTKRRKALHTMKKSLLSQSLELGKEGTIIRIDLETYQIKDGQLFALAK